MTYLELLPNVNFIKRGVEMEQYIAIIIFSLPGLITYFWIQMFGINPTVKHTPSEMIGLTALLWAPTIFLTILTYNCLYFFIDILLKHLNLNWSKLNLTYLIKLEDINSLSNNLLFLLYFVILTLIFSFVTGFLWSRFIYSIVLDLINKVRIKRKVIKLSEDTTVWDSFFYKLEDEKEDQLIVEMYKIDNPNFKVCGAVIRMSRPFETERSFIIDYSKGWDKAHQHYNYAIKKTYVDTKSGMIINELDYQKPVPKIIS